MTDKKNMKKTDAKAAAPKQEPAKTATKQEASKGAPNGAPLVKAEAPKEQPKGTVKQEVPKGTPKEAPASKSEPPKAAASSSKAEAPKIKVSSVKPAHSVAMATDAKGTAIDPSILTAEDRIQVQRHNALYQRLKAEGKALPDPLPSGINGDVLKDFDEWDKK